MPPTSLLGRLLSWILIGVKILLLAVKNCSTRLVLFAESKDIGEAHALVQEFLPVITMAKIKVWHS